MRYRRFPLALTALALGLGAAPVACSSDFDLTRVVPPRGTLGHEMFSMLCDRVGAQALREDVTGASYHAVCHPDPVTGQYADTVDQELLPPLDPNAVDVDGNVVPMALQITHRAYRVARIQAMAKDRDNLIGAFDAALPDDMIPIKDLTNADPAETCDPAGTGGLHDQLADVVGRFTPLENDGTFPLFTGALGHIMDDVRQDPDAQQALAKMDARQGYRPAEIALGAARPALAYPRLVPLVNAFLKLIATDSDPLNPAGAIVPNLPLGVTNRLPIAGAASGQFQELLSVMHEELRTATPDATLAPLAVKADPQIAARQLLSRPRSDLEVTRSILLQQDPAFAIGGGTPSTEFLAQRDLRGVAAVPLVDGAVPAPFVDADGDHLPDLDVLGQFVTQGGATIASPFFSIDGKDGPRDTNGRAVGTTTPLLYNYIDARQTFLANTTQSLEPLFNPAPSGEAIMKLLGGLPVVFGPRDASPTTTKQYAPDPSLVADWALVHPGTAAPAGLGTAPVTLSYRAFHPEKSPIVDLVYALGQLLATPGMDDLLQLARSLVVQHPQALARLIGLGLKIKAIADAHPEAHIPAKSTLWDELLDDIAKIAHVKDNINNGGILEDLFLAFANDDTVNLQGTFSAYTKFRDALTYNHNSTASDDLLNGPAFNLTTNDTSPLKTPVDRTMPDVGTNQSGLERFMQLLHDANGLGACTKDGAIVPIDWNGISLHYPPQSIGEHIVLDPVCLVFTGSAAPSHLNTCGILRIPNVDALLLDIALDRAQFDVRDPCLKALMTSPLTGIVGGTDAFLQSISGITGFDTHPTVPGIARLVYFDTAHDSDPGDTNPATSKTANFLSAILDPVPTMVCAPAPFTDTDGTVVNLRQCSTFADTIRGRDPGFLFPIEEFNFVTNVQALAETFDDHGQPLLFVDLFDTLDVHWGSSAQPTTECDPTLPHSDARWCSQDAAVTYEPLLADVLDNTDLFQALHDTVPIIAATTVAHCDATDPNTGACRKTSTKNGVQVLADAVRQMVDPAWNVGLKDAQGNQTAPRNDGTTNPQVTPIYLFIDALDEIDAAFNSWAALNPNDDQRQVGWKDARSQLVDTFLTIDGTGAQSTFHNQAVPAILPTLIDTVQAQILAHCPDRSSAAACPWAQHDLTNNLSNVVSGPTFAATIDLLDSLRANDSARTELEMLMQYLLDPTSANEAQSTTLGAMTDVLQVMSDDANLSPLYNAIADTVGASLVRDDGTVVKRSLADGAVESLSRIFAQSKDATGTEICASEIDPNQAIAATLTHFVTPMGANQPTPIEVLIDTVADVNRAQPGADTKLAPTDYGNMANEISEFCEDPASGLAQVYVVIRQATLE